MSLSLLFLLIIIIAVCVYIFTKTVSNDVKNDFRLRDILSNSDEDSINLNKNSQRVKTEEATVDNVYANNVYEELANKQYQQNSNNYSTTAHTSDEPDKKTEQNKYNQETYYEKINDDACTDTYNDFQNEYEQEYKINNFKKNYKQKNRFIDYIKIFWRGITFTIGLLVCIYSFIGLAYNVQTSNDALIFSLWLLIGVILVK